MRRAWLAIAMVMACGDDTPSGDEGTTDDGSTSTSPSTSTSSMSSPSTSAATEATDGSTTGDTTGEPGSESGSSESTSSESGEPTSSDSSSSSSSESSGSDSSSSTGALACTVHGVLDTVPMLARADLVDDQNFEGSCSVAGSPEAIFTFTAPATGRYHFDALTLDSVADAVLYVLDGECEGPQLDCNAAEYWEEAYAAVVSVDMFEGDTVTLIVESSSGDNGEVEIAVMPEESCPAADLGSTVPQTISGSLAGVPNDYVVPCDDESAANDAGFLFTAPADGGYQFTATEAGAPQYGLPMFAHSGGCDGDVYACTTSWYAVDGQPLSLRMQAGETTALFVTQRSNYSDVHFDLTIDEVEIPECPMGEVPAVLPASVASSILAAGNDFASSCGGEHGEDAELTFTAPSDGSYLFVPESFEVYPIMSVLDGTCGGTELACRDAFEGGGEPGVVVDLAAGQEVTVVVDDEIGWTGAFDLVVDRFEGDCVDEDLGALAPPFDVVGTTTGATNSSFASCSGITAPDYGVSWTPTVAGNYTFSTAGSSYWSTISVRDATCDGAELDCERGYYYGNTGALVNVSLAAGQTVIIVVDGYDSGAGDFVLHVEEQQPPGDCCDGVGGAGCENAAIQACVCGNDEYCCDYYESSCVEIAIEGCDTECS